MSPDLFQLLFIAIGYAVSSSALAVVNKWALLSWPYASSLTVVQFTVAWMFAFAIGKIGLVPVDPFNWAKAKAFSPACLLFYISIACNMKLLEAANVDTFIVLRSLVPILTLVAETMFLKTPLPDRRAIAALFLIVCGAAGYVATDSSGTVHAYFWGFAYVSTMVVDTIVIKKIVTEVELTPWGLVFYNNLIASAMYPLFVVLTGEYSKLSDELSSGSTNSPAGVDQLSVYGPILVSCVFGISISYFGLNARKKLQATAFSVLGVMCKFLTVLINSTVWEHHASPIGIFFLLITIVGGIAYQQVMKMQVITKSNSPPPLTSNNDPAETDPLAGGNDGPEKL